MNVLIYSVGFEHGYRIGANISLLKEKHIFGRISGILSPRREDLEKRINNRLGQKAKRIIIFITRIVIFPSKFL